jgi:hypothetical protein
MINFQLRCHRHDSCILEGEVAAVVAQVLASRLKLAFIVMYGGDGAS